MKELAKTTEHSNPTKARVLLETSDALPLVSVSIATPQGAVLDPPGLEGLSRFMARLMRRTAKNRNAQDNEAIIDALGGSLGAEVTYSALTVHGTVIVRSLSRFVDHMLETLSEPSFNAEELELLKRETESELIESLDNDRSLVRRGFRRLLFEGHPYGRSLIGTPKSVPQFTQERVSDLHRALFTNDLTFAFAGDIEPEQAREIAERIGASLPQANTVVDPVPEPRAKPGRRLLIIDKPERTQTQILIGGLGSHPHDEDHVALQVANTVFGGTFTARLTQEVRAKRGWSYGAYSSLPYDRQRQGFSMWTFPKADDAAACIKLELDLLKAWREHGITKKELNAAKRYLVRSHAFSIDTPSKRVGLKLDSVIYDLPPGYYEEYTDRIQAVTLEQANQAIQNRISDRDLLVAVLGTESDIGGPVREAIDDLAEAKVVPFDAIE